MFASRPSHPLRLTVSLVAIIAALVALQPAAVWAHHTAPLKITLTKFKCIEETNDGPGDDEIYAVAFVADLTPLVPNPMTFKTRVREDVDEGTRHFNLPIWAINGGLAAIDQPNDVVILVALMEHDNSSPASVKTAVHTSLAIGVASYKQNGLDRASMIRNLQTDMNGAIDLGKASGVRAVSDGDERLGSAQELRLTAGDLRSARRGTTVTKSLEFRGDGGHYRLSFDITNQ
jgi:hypothetical protein